MSGASWWPLLPALPFALAAALLLAGRHAPRRAAAIGLGAALLGAAAALWQLLPAAGAPGWARADAAGGWLLGVGSAVALLAALARWRDAAAGGDPAGGMPDRRPALAGAAAQGLIGCHHLSVLAEGPLLAWLALAGATGCAAALPACSAPADDAAAESVSRSAEQAAARAASLRLLRLGGAGAMLLLLGLLLAAAALPGLAGGWAAAALPAGASPAPGAAALALALLLAGGCVGAGLVPGHAWWPGAAAALPPSQAPLLELLSSAALLLLLRAAAALDGIDAPGPSPGALLAALGFASLWLAAAAAWRPVAHPVGHPAGSPVGAAAGRRRAWAAIGQNGAAVIGFGLGAPLAGLLQWSAGVLQRAAVASAGDAVGARWRQLLLSGLPPAAGGAALLALSLAASARSPWLLLPLLGGAALLAAGLLRAWGEGMDGAEGGDAVGVPGGGWMMRGAFWLPALLALALAAAPPALLRDAAALLAPESASRRPASATPAAAPAGPGATAPGGSGATPGRPDPAAPRRAPPAAGGG